MDLFWKYHCCNWMEVMFTATLNYWDSKVEPSILAQLGMT